MRINTNVSSLTAQEAAQNTSKNITTSLEKLSTGLRINKASDDASGLAIADKLRTQATSINQGIANGNSAVSLLQIADKSMAEQSNILDTVKSKLIQANADTTSADGREAIRKDISKLLEQLDNIAKQTNYNGKVLLQASSTNQEQSADLSFQIGEKSTDLITNKAIRSNTLGLGLAEAEKHTTTISAANSTTYNMNIAGQKVSYTSDANATVDEIHAGLKAAIEANSTLNSMLTVSNQKASGDTELVITNKTNNESFTSVSSIGSAVASQTTDATDTPATPPQRHKVTTAAIPAFDNATDSVAYSLDGQSITINPSSLDASGAAIGNTATAAKIGEALKVAIEGNTYLNSNYTVTDNGNSRVTLLANVPDSTKVVANFNSIITNDGTAGTAVNATIDTQGKDGLEIDSVKIDAVAANKYEITVGDRTVSYTAKGTDTTADIATGLRKALNNDSYISANYSVTINSGNTSKIDIKGTVPNSAFTTTSAVYQPSTLVSDSLTTAAGTGASLADLKNLTTLTKEEAASFQAVVDDAITDLNGYRGDIGSTQNQVESAVRNLMTQATNVKAAESIIRDVDYAQESANFNKQNIISQAGSYAISQANAVQQNVLRLLQ